MTYDRFPPSPVSDALNEADVLLTELLEGPSRGAFYGIGQPDRDGLYAVEVYHGWKLLEWYKGEWWHMDRVGRWTACIPHQWVGPLPTRKYQPGVQAAKQEFDL